MIVIVLILEHPVQITLAILTLIKVKSCNALLYMLMIHNLIYLKSFLRHKFLILDNSYPEFIFRQAKI